MKRISISLSNALSAAGLIGGTSVGTGALAQSQGGYGMGSGMMGGGYGGIWMPVLLVIVVAGLVAWIVAQNKK